MAKKLRLRTKSKIENEIMTAKEIQSNFQVWWDQEGSSLRPLKNEDNEEHSQRIANIAWTNGAYKVQIDLLERNSRYYDIKP